MLDEMLEVERSDKIYPGINTRVFADFEREDTGPAEFQGPSFQVGSGYTLILKVGVDFIANDVELHRKTELAKEQLRHALYKDVITDLHGIGNLSQDAEVQKRVYALIKKLQVT